MPRRRDRLSLGTAVLRRLALLALGTLALAACDRDTDLAAEPASSARAPTSVAAPNAVPHPTSPPIASVGDASRGRALVEKHECNRCHDATGLEPTVLEKHCFHCHERIMTGTVHAAPATIAKWKRTVAPLRVAPTLRGAIRRFSSEWLESYLVEPHDLRPALPSTMPRLGLGREQARDIVAYLATQEPQAKSGVARPPAREGRVVAGKRLLADKKCASCHAI
jgi:mono/diheme cytochrome c family protein